MGDVWFCFETSAVPITETAEMGMPLLLMMQSDVAMGSTARKKYIISHSIFYTSNYSSPDWHLAFPTAPSTHPILFHGYRSHHACVRCDIRDSLVEFGNIMFQGFGQQKPGHWPMPVVTPHTSFIRATSGPTLIATYIAQQNVQTKARERGKTPPSRVANVPFDGFKGRDICSCTVRDPLAGHESSRIRLYPHFMQHV